MRALLVAAMLAAPPAQADDAFSAIGRISYSEVLAPGAAICTGTLVAPDLVLTAGHCLRGAVDDPAGVWFAPGLHDGQTGPSVAGAEIILTPGASDTGFADDVALLRLAQAITVQEAVPLPLAEPQAMTFTLVAYARSAPDSATRSAPCHSVAAPAPLMGLTCPVVSGNSGAPVLQRGATGWQVVAVVVASASNGASTGPRTGASTGRLRALATTPAPALRARIIDALAATP